MYRNRLCAYCDVTAIDTCSRCACVRCLEHFGTKSWCAICECELKEEEAVAASGSDLRRENTVWGDCDAFTWGRSSTLHWVIRRWRRYEARRKFLKRSRDEIAAWRHDARIWVREGAPHE